MYTVDFYKSKMDAAPSSSTPMAQPTIEAMLKEAAPSYKRVHVPPFSIAIDGQNVSPIYWHERVIPAGARVSITVEPKFSIVLGIISIVSAVYAYTQIPDIPDTGESTPDGSSVYKASAQLNQAKVFGIRPEIFGHMPRFPDLMAAGHKDYIDNEEWAYYPFYVGEGRFAIDDALLAFTSVKNYPGDVFLEFAGPGELLDNPAAQNMYTAPEVGQTTSGSQEIKYDALNLSDESWTYSFEGKTITSKFDGQLATFPFLVGQEFRLPSDNFIYRVESLAGSTNETATLSRRFNITRDFGGLF